jgi:DNA-binding NtrC family response regulator/predicted negative regulator of RcsB-dependent stress response
MQLDGNVPAALFHAEAATELAEKSGDEARLAWAHLGLLRLQVDTGAGPHLTTQLARAGDLARRSGLAHPLAYFHECVSISEGQQGRLATALHHCESAESLLAQDPNIALQGTLLLNRSCLRYLGGDYENAFEDLRCASASIARSGLARNAGALKNNLAHLELLTGRLADARRSFESLSQSQSVSFYVRIGALDGLARTHLAEGAVDLCDAELSRLENYADKTDLDSLYHVRWASVTRVRVLLARGHLREALHRAHQLQGTAMRVDDAHLRGTVLLLAARAQHALGQHAEAARDLLRAEDVVENTPQLRAEYCHHAAALVTDHDPSAAQLLEERANRLWSESGALGLRNEVEHSEPPHAQTRSREEQAPFSPLATALAIEACLDATGTPRDLAQALSVLTSGLGLDAGTEASDTFLPPHPAAALAACSVHAFARVARSGQAPDHRHAPPLVRGDIALPQRSTEMELLHSMAQRIASTDASVLITGETGTGKDLLARFIHQHSASATGPFVPFNCAAMAKDLFDSQLFGHCKGAFTGAGEDSLGVIRATAGGTLFLDEVGEMGLDTQPKLLRFLESGEVHPVGATRAANVCVRVVAATNANLESMVAEGRFREDLYYRLGIVRFRLPPLRKRRTEILPLARRFLQEFATRYNKGILALDDDAAVCLERCDWPGNVRQLVNEMKRVAALADPGARVGAASLSPELQRANQHPVADPPAEAAAIPMAQPLKTAVETLERAHLVHALDACGGHSGRAAGMLGLSRKGLYLKRRRYGL